MFEGSFKIDRAIAVVEEMIVDYRGDTDTLVEVLRALCEIRDTDRVVIAGSNATNTRVTISNVTTSGGLVVN